MLLAGVLPDCYHISSKQHTTVVIYRYDIHEYFFRFSFEGKIHHVPVLKLDDVFGFDANTCIFESIHELVNHYAIVSFSIHDQKYGDLKLTEQRLN